MHVQNAVSKEKEMWLIILLLFLFLCSVTDIRTGKIPLSCICSGIMIAIVYFIALVVQKERLPWEIFPAVAPGIVLLVLAGGGKGIGGGDGMLVLITGLFFSFRQNMLLLLLSFFICGAAVAVLLFLKRIKRRDKIPFVPFLFLASCIVGVVS